MHAGRHPLIVLMTDFGLSDTYVGQMKGVILSLAPSAQIIDLTHAITAQNVAQGAFLLGKSAPFFPEKAIFVAVVDPGVGTSRKAIAVETTRHIFLAPTTACSPPFSRQERSPALSPSPMNASRSRQEVQPFTGGTFFHRLPHISPPALH